MKRLVCIVVLSVPLLACDEGRHLHFEVVVPDDPLSAIPSGFTGDFPYTLKIPRFCNVTGGIVEKDKTYTAAPCPQ